MATIVPSPPSLTKMRARVSTNVHYKSCKNHGMKSPSSAAWERGWGEGILTTDPCTLAPAPTKRGRGGAPFFANALPKNHSVKAPRPLDGRGVGGEGIYPS